MAKDPLQSLLRETGPQYGELVDYLSSRRMMPPIKYEYIRPGTGGTFAYPGFLSNPMNLPETGVVTVAPGADPSTVVHELTHAADRQISEQYHRLQYKKSLSPQEKQFMSAFEKLSWNSNEPTNDPKKQPRKQLANLLSPEWVDKNSYRAGHSELPAWGMGSVVGGRDTEYKPPLHLDPTMATEFSILMDMATRLQKSYPVTDKR